MYFARHGYVYALVDVRGRGNSGGTFDPFAQEARDGYDVVEWLARQPLVQRQGGDVGRLLRGLRPVGHRQGAAAAPRHHRPRRLGPPRASTSRSANNIFYSYDMQWLTYTSGRAKNTLTCSATARFWSQKYREMYLAHRPFRELDRIVGNPSPIFQPGSPTPPTTTTGRRWRPRPEQFAKIDLPILTITGHYDGDQPGALTYYRDHLRYASPAARDRHYLIIGPWDHAGTRTPNAEVGGLTFGAASVLDLNALHKEWYDWTMKGGPPPRLPGEEGRLLRGRPRGRDVEARRLPGGDRRRAAHPLSQLSKARPGTPSTPAISRTARPAAAAAPDRYVYDPLDVRPAEALEREIPGNLVDQSAALNLLGNGAVYHSEPFAEATEISGQVKLTLWIALDVPDTDFQADLYEILPDGGSVLLTSDNLRARYRDSLEKETLVPKGEIVRYDFTGFTWFSRRVSKGSRLRLVISCPNTVGGQKNYNSGGVVADETAKDARTAHVAIYHDAGASERAGDPARPLRRAGPEWDTISLAILHNDPRRRTRLSSQPVRPVRKESEDGWKIRAEEGQRRAVPLQPQGGQRPGDPGERALHREAGRAQRHRVGQAQRPDRRALRAQGDQERRALLRPQGLQRPGRRPERDATPPPPPWRAGSSR